VNKLTKAVLWLQVVKNLLNIANLKGKIALSVLFNLQDSNLRLDKL